MELRKADRKKAEFPHGKIAPRFEVALVAALVVIAVYIPALFNNFVGWDDSVYIVENHFIRSLNPYFFKKAFLGFYAANWHPLTWISHALDYSIWGLNPFGHHLTSVMLHGMNVFLVVVLATKLLKAAKRGVEKSAGILSEKGILIAAAVTGLLFGIHPLHVESVAWAAERKDVLCAFFCLLGAIAYANFSEAKRKPRGENAGTVISTRWYLASFFFFALALMSKPMAVTLPVILLILDWYPFRKFDTPGGFRKSLKEKIPFFALSLASCVVTVLAQRAGHALATVEMMPVPVRIAVGFHSMFDYLVQMVLPLRLVPFYPYPRQVSFLTFRYVFPLLAAAALAFFFVLEARRGRRLWAAAFSCYAVMLLPVLGFVQVGAQAMANRYTYLPSLGPFFIVGIGCAKLFDRYFTGRRHLHIKIVSSIALLLVFSVLTALTRQQIGIWKNGITLWTREIKFEPGVLRAYNDRGIAFMKAGDYRDAVKDFTTLISLTGGDPGYLPFYNRARALAYLGRTKEALKDATRAVNISPGACQPYYIRGKIYMIEGRYDKAVRDFSTGIRLNPDLSELYFNRAASYFHMARYKEAIRDLSTAIRLNPGLGFRYYGNRGVVYEKIGMYKEAQKDFSRALAIDRNAPDLLYRLGTVYLKTGKPAKALGDFTRAIDLSARPSPLYYSGRSRAYKKLGRFEDAKRDAELAKKAQTPLQRK